MVNLDTFLCWEPEDLVGRFYYIDYRQVRVDNTYVLNGFRYYICRWMDTSEVWTCPAVDVFIFFDDYGRPIKEFDNIGSLDDTLQSFE